MSNSGPHDALAALPALKDVIAAHGLRAHKSLGQNFILDPGITDRIAGVVGNVDGARIIEIGPGPGGLTRSLLATKAHDVVAIEFDARAVAALQDVQQAAGGRLTLMHTDALKIDWDTVWATDRPNILVANLPYNIATPLLVQWLNIIHDRPGTITRMALMFQREVALRITAAPDTSDYGRLGVLAQWLCTTQMAMTLPPGAFVPPPKVHSSVVRFDPRVLASPIPSFSGFEHMLARAFGHRRKMLRAYLKDWLPYFESCGIAPDQRAENLTLDQYIALARQIEGLT